MTDSFIPEHDLVDLSTPRNYLLSLLKINPAYDDTQEHRGKFWREVYLTHIKMIHPSCITDDMINLVTEDNIQHLFDKYPQR